MPRLPSSLKWLVDKRGRIDGEIKKIESSLAKCQKLMDSLEELKVRLASIDRTLELHEVKIDPQYIPTIHSHEVRVSLPRGELTRSILLCLKLNNGNPVGTNDIAKFLAARHAELDSIPTDFKQLRTSVRYRLKNLCNDGVVVRHHLFKFQQKVPYANREEGLWTLADN